jgi:hypothetical protein
MRAALISVPLFILGFVVPAQAASFSLPHLLSFRPVHAYVTGYNTTPGQTDDTPCVAASGANICGRTDAVACPRRISLGTFLMIRGEIYVCEDRLAKKYDSRFDISCDKDTDCPGKVTGWTEIMVFAENPCRTPSPASPAPRPVAALAKPLLRLAALMPRRALIAARAMLPLRNHAHWTRPA